MYLSTYLEVGWGWARSQSSITSNRYQPYDVWIRCFTSAYPIICGSWHVVPTFPMILSLISNICWSIRCISLGILNLVHNIIPFFSVGTLDVYSILAITILLPVMTMLIWCCLAVDEWMMEDDSRGAFRRMLHEAEEARIREEMERRNRKQR